MMNPCSKEEGRGSHDRESAAMACGCWSSCCGGYAVLVGFRRDSSRDWVGDWYCNGTLLPPITAAGYGIGRYLKKKNHKGKETALGVGFSPRTAKPPSLQTLIIGINLVILLISVWSVQMLKQNISEEEEP